MAPVPASVIGPYLAGAQKDLVTTALGHARVWATVGQGIVTEVYWPSVGEPQIRDLGFIVAGDGWWYEVKAQNDYQFQLPDPAAPLGTAIHDGPPDHPYRLEVEVVPDPDRDALHVRFALSGVAASVYVFLASHLQTQHPDRDDAGGRANTAWVDPAGRLNAWGEARYLCLAAAGGFRKTSVGSFGTSDVWHDFAQNGDMTWAFTEAGPGFVVLAGECGQQGVLARCFADSEASTTNPGPASVKAQVISPFWAKSCHTSDVPNDPTLVFRKPPAAARHKYRPSPQAFRRPAGSTHAVLALPPASSRSGCCVCRCDARNTYTEAATPLSANRTCSASRSGSGTTSTSSRYG